MDRLNPKPQMKYVEFASLEQGKLTPSDLRNLAAKLEELGSKECFVFVSNSHAPIQFNAHILETEEEAFARYQQEVEYVNARAAYFNKQKDRINSENTMSKD